MPGCFATRLYDSPFVSVSTIFRKKTFYLKNPHLYEYHLSAYFRGVPDEPVELDNLALSSYTWPGKGSQNFGDHMMSQEWKDELNAANGEVVKKTFCVVDLSGFGANPNFSIAAKDPGGGAVKKNCIFEALSIRRVKK